MNTKDYKIIKLQEKIKKYAETPTDSLRDEIQEALEGLGDSLIELSENDIVLEDSVSEGDSPLPLYKGNDPRAADTGVTDYGNDIYEMFCSNENVDFTGTRRDYAAAAGYKYVFSNGEQEFFW